MADTTILNNYPARIRMFIIKTESPESSVEHTLTSGMMEESFLRPRLQRRSESSLSTDSCSSRSSMVSSTSSFSDGERFSAFGLPLELELSIMGTVDQCLLDRGQVALIKRSRSFNGGRLSPSRGSNHTEKTSSLDRRRMTVDEHTQVDKQGLFTTTLCSTEL